MRRHASPAIPILLAATLACLSALPIHAQNPSPDAAQWRKDLSAWRTQREQSLAAPDSWLTLIGLEWLKPGVNTVGSAPGNQIRIPAKAPDHIGLLTVSAKNLQILAPAGGFPPDLTIDGKPAREGLLAADDAKPNIIAWHGLTMVVLHRGDRYALRIKDADSPTRTSFHGLNWYPPDPHFRVAARWIPYNPPHTEKIPTVIGTTLNLPSPGVAEFTLDGKTLRLEPVTEGGDQTASSSSSSGIRPARPPHTKPRASCTPACPTTASPTPAILELDFNKLENPPCAYTSYATCPLPPEQNRLPSPHPRRRTALSPLMRV
jgi:uncharacterized protein (DUF1684 family)